MDSSYIWHGMGQKCRDKIKHFKLKKYNLLKTKYYKKKLILQFYKIVQIVAVVDLQRWFAINKIKSYTKIYFKRPWL